MQQTCPPPVANCFETMLEGFCCPRYECPVHTVRMGTNSSNLSITPYEKTPSQSVAGSRQASAHSQSTQSDQRGSVKGKFKSTRTFIYEYSWLESNKLNLYPLLGCFVDNKLYGIGDRILGASGPCMDCICDLSGMMKCSPKECAPEDPLLQQINNEVLASTLTRTQAR